MSKDKLKLSYKNNNFANSEPQLLRVQINACEDLDSFNNDQVLINDYLKNDDFDDFLRETQEESNTSIPSNNIFEISKFKIDEIKFSESLFNNKNFESKNNETNANQESQIKTLSFEKIDNSDELILPETQLVKNENLQFDSENNLSENQTIPVIPKYEIIENDTLDVSNFEIDLSQKSDDFNSQIEQVKNKKDFEIDDNQWTIVPNFDFNPPKNFADKIIETSSEIVFKPEKDNKQLKEPKKTLDKKEKSKIKNNKKITSSNKKNEPAKKDIKEEVVSPEIIKVKPLKSTPAKINKQKQSKKPLESKLNRQVKPTKKVKPKKNELLITSNEGLEIQNFNNNQTYIKPNNEIISNDLDLNNKTENNLFLSPLPVNAEKLQDYYENNFYLSKKSLNNPNKKVQEIEPIASLTSFKYKFKGPEIVASDSFVNNFLKPKKNKK